MPLITGNALKSSGFSMIEVLVSLLIIVVGVLGMVGLQSKAIPYTQDSVQRNTAIMLASDLVELIRSNQFDPSKNIQDFKKMPGASFPSAPSSCTPTPSSINNQLGCWAAQAMKVLPGASDGVLATNQFYVCWSAIPGDTLPQPAQPGIPATPGCAGGGELEIRLAWTVVHPGDCMDNTQGTTCFYTLRTRL
jgi:type IV pilus assembly protein PilV